MAEKGKALGLVETRGWVGMVEAADAMAKAADVKFIGYESVGRGYACAVVRGDVAAVRASVDAGMSAAGEVGELVCGHVIAQPHEQLEDILPIASSKPKRGRR